MKSFVRKFWKPGKSEFEPASWDVADAAAVKALARGDASPNQQQRALDWIIKHAAMTYDEAFVPGQPDVSDYRAGRISVGRQIVGLINVQIRGKNDNTEQPP